MNVHLGAGREGTLVVATEHIECCSSEKVPARIEVNAVGADARVAYCAIQWTLGVRRGG